MGFVSYISSQFSFPRGFGGALSTAIMNRLNSAQYRAVEQLYRKRMPERVLDIGFGNGCLLEKLSRSGSARLWGIEVSDDMLARAGKRCAKQIRDGRMRLSRGEAGRIPFDSASFDFVYTVNTVYFWPELQRGYDEIKRVLAPGGVFANVFYAKEWLDRLRYTQYGFVKYAPEDLHRQVKQFGFSASKLIWLGRSGAFCLLARR